MDRYVFDMGQGKDAIVEVEHDVDNMAVWSITEVNEHLRWCSTHHIMPDGEPIVLLQGKETLTYYVARKSDVNKVNTNGVISLWMNLYHVENIYFSDRPTSNCPECGCTSPFQLWNSVTGKRLT